MAEPESSPAMLRAKLAVLDPSQRREVAAALRSVAETFAEVPTAGRRLHAPDACPHARLRLTGADPYLSCQANSACRAKSPEGHHQHKPTPKWDWSTTERETHDRHARRPAVARRVPEEDGSR